MLMNSCSLLTSKVEKKGANQGARWGDHVMSRFRVWYVAAIDKGGD